MILLLLWVVFPLLAGAVLYGLERLICWLEVRLCWALPLVMGIAAWFGVTTGLENNPDVGYLLTFFFVPQGIGWTAGLVLGLVHGLRGPRRIRKPRPPKPPRKRRPRTLRESKGK